jgi:hypothetical protein
VHHGAAVGDAGVEACRGEAGGYARSVELGGPVEAAPVSIPTRAVVRAAGPLLWSFFSGSRPQSHVSKGQTASGPIVHIFCG